MQASLSGFVGGVKTRLAVESSTASNDDPTPIYVLDELVQTLSAGDARAGVDAICARLAHRSPVVKQKALKLVSHVGRKGSPDLRRLLARQSGAVRELLHYRCEPDPFKGDTVWKRVQEYAQEALSALHGEGEAAQPSQRSLGGRIQGFGSEAASGGSSGMAGFGSESAASSGGGASSSGRMVGFGSGDVLNSGMQAISSGMRSLSNGLGRQQGVGLLGQEGYAAGQLDDDSGYRGASSSSSSRPGPSGSSTGLSQPIMQAGTPALAASSGGAGAGVGRALPGAAEAAAGGQHLAEQRLVDRICTPAGLRAAPGRDDLHAFVEGINPLDGQAVAQLLQHKLDAGPWQATLRALCAIEAVVEAGSSAACGQLAVHYQTNPEAVRRAADSPQASVRQRAHKVLALLGGPAGEGGGANGTAAAGSSQQQQLFTEDLLGESEPAGGGASSSSASAAAGLADLLGEAAPAAGSGGVADLLAGLDLPSAGPAVGSSMAAQPPAANGAAADLFGGMLLGSQQPASHPAALPRPVAAPIAAAAAAAPPSSLDLLGGLELHNPAPAAAAGQPAAHAGGGGLGDLLGGLSLGPAGPAAAPLHTGSSGGGGSGGASFPMHHHGMQQQAYGGMPSAFGGPGFQAPLQAPLAGSFGGMAAAGPQQGFMGGQAAPYSAGGMQQAWHQPSGGGPPSAGYTLGGAASGGGGAMGGSGRLGSGGSGALLGPRKDQTFNFVDDAIQSLRKK